MDGTVDGIAIEKEAVRKHLEWGGNKKEKKTHSLCLLHATCVHGMAAEGSYLSCQLRESKLHNERKNKLIENCSGEKKIDIGQGGLKNHRQTHHHRLRVALLGC